MAIIKTVRDTFSVTSGSVKSTSDTEQWMRELRSLPIVSEDPDENGNVRISGSIVVADMPNMDAKGISRRISTAAKKANLRVKKYWEGDAAEPSKILHIAVVENLNETARIARERAEAEARAEAEREINDNETDNAA